LISVTLTYSRRLMALLVAVLLIVGWIAPSATTQAIEGWSRSATLKVLAVNEKGEGLAIDVVIRVTYPGSGSLKTVGPGSMARDTVDSVRLSLLYASILTGLDPSLLDVYIEIPAQVSLEGPSATLLFTLAITALIRGDQVNSTYSATGILAPGGIVGGVGGLKAKFTAAEKAALTRVIASMAEPYPSPIYYPSITILDAYRAFTGADILEPATWSQVLSSANTSVLQGFNDSYIFFKELYENYSALLPGSWMDEYRSIAIQYYDRAVDMYSRGLYYAAASMAFTGLFNIIASYLSYTYTYNQSLFRSELGNITSKANSTITGILTGLEDLTSSLLAGGDIDLCSIDMLAMVYARVLEAYRGLQSLSSEPLNTTLASLIYSASYYYARSLTALKWLELANATLKSCSSGIRFTRDNIDGVLGYLEYALGIRLGYLNDLTNSSIDLVKLPIGNKLSRLAYYIALIEDASLQFYSLDGVSSILPVDVNASTYGVILDEYATLLQGLVSESGSASGIPLSDLTLIELVESNTTLQSQGSYSASLVFRECSKLYTYLYLTRALEWSREGNPLREWSNIRAMVAIASLVLVFIGSLLIYRSTRKYEAGMRS